MFDSLKPLSRFSLILMVVLMLPFMLAGGGALAVLADDPQVTPLEGPGFLRPERLDNRLLAYVFLANRELLEGRLGQIFEQFMPLHSSGKPLNFSLTYVVRYPDGSSDKLVFPSFDALARKMAQLTNRQVQYGAIIQSRGFRWLASAYRVTLPTGCADQRFVDDWFNDHAMQVQVHQVGFRLRLEQDGRRFHGVSVGNTVTIASTDGTREPLSGTFFDDRIHLTGEGGACQIRLVPMTGGTS